MIHHYQKKNIAILGTGSNVGKSTVVTALCRIFRNQGIKVAPFKAQNMSNNAYVTREGGEMSRAQVVQAQAAGLEPHVDMNPILLKPVSDSISQLIIHGQAIANIKASDYFNVQHTNQLWSAVEASLHRLQQTYEMIIIEGAGSCAEVNLFDRDICNGRVAVAADADIIFVADIDKGGVFAQVVGTLELMPVEHRRLVKGIIINKFRGDISLFQSGVEWLEQKTQVPILGVVPYFRDILLDEEDALSANSMLNSRNKPDANYLNIAVIYLPHVSNVSDFSILEREPSVSLHYFSKPCSLQGYDLVILPGSKNVMFDMQWLRETGWEKQLKDFHAQGGEVGGICGGLQMLGKTILDPHHVETDIDEIKGLNFFDYTTVLTQHKTVKQQRACFVATGESLIGYEIHAGQTQFETKTPFARFEDNTLDGIWDSENRCWCTYLHGVFDADDFRESFLSRFTNFRKSSQKLIDPYEQLAEHFLKYCVAVVPNFS